MTRTPQYPNLKPTAAEEDLIKRFETAFNSIDIRLAELLNIQQFTAFAKIVRKYSASRSNWPEQDFLLKAAILRNDLVHGRTESLDYIVPSIAVVEKLEGVLEDLKARPRVISKFGKKVDIVSSGESLAGVLRLIAQRDYSQFPVYDDESFCGLLTENGITRWLARQVTQVGEPIAYEVVSVGQVLVYEEEASNFLFISKDRWAEEVVAAFADHELLEAVLITEDGTKSGNLLGIATRWDIVQSLGLPA